MNGMRAYLTEQLSAKVSRHGVVVWEDPRGEYREFVESVIPEDVALHKFEGSWYELRRRLEPDFAGLEPRLVVYVNAEAPDEDPLEELRATGTEYRLRLATLLRRTMSEDLTSTKIDEIARAATTLADAEALVAGGASGGPARLVKALRVAEPTEIALTLVMSGSKVLATHPELQEDVASFLRSHLGIETTASPEALADSVARHLVLVELADLTGALPETLAHALPKVSAEQGRRCANLLKRWGNDRTASGVYRQVMGRASADLDLAAQLDWIDRFTDVDTVPAYQELAFGEMLRRIGTGAFAEAEALAAAVDASYGSLASMLEGYAAHNWEIDRAHRQLEFALLALVARERIEDAVRDARQAYDDWLDKSIRAFTSKLATEGLAHGPLLPQGDIHRHAVAPRAKRGSVAYFMVDALRFELGHDLVDALRRQFEDPQVEVEPAVALPPSITRVGMANLCPGAGENLQLDLTDGDRLVVRIGAFEVTGVEDRLSLLRAAHGKVADLRLDDVFRLGERELGEQVGRANLVLVRSQEIDDSGESGKISAHLQSFDATVQQLSRAVARLAQQGVSQFVITADHGFLALTRDLGPHAIIPKPGGRGEIHRRAFVGRGGRVGDALVRVPLSKIGLPGDLDVLVPRGLALIAAGGARGFFHGGASPQELVVPVITVEVQPPTAASLFVVDASLTAKITSQVFTGKLLMPESLLSAPLTVRPVPIRRSDDREVGVLVTAGGAEQGERLVQLRPGAEVSLGFRATTSLGKGDRIELQVFDAQTDRRLASSRPSTVARALEVDDELL